MSAATTKAKLPFGLKKRQGSPYFSYKFRWQGEVQRGSTHVENARVATQIVTAIRDALAKGDVGIVERKRAPTLKQFAEDRFLPFVRGTFKEKTKTLAYYENGVQNLLKFEPLANAKLDPDAITTETITQYATHRLAAGLETSSVNRELEVLRRMFALAQEWRVVEKVLPKVKTLPGEKHRDRVLPADVEAAYLTAALEIGRKVEDEYKEALTGIRALKRGQKPILPADPYRLLHVATILFEFALRPEEVNRLRWEFVHDGYVEIPKGKTRDARRQIPLSLSPKIAGILEMRRETAKGSPWVFPAPTKSGHIEPSTIDKQHAKACRDAKIEPFVLYTLRHTALTGWAPIVDPWLLRILAGHASMNSTARYVHPPQDTLGAAGEKVRAHKEAAKLAAMDAKRGQAKGQGEPSGKVPQMPESPVIN